MEHDVIVVEAEVKNNRFLGGIARWAACALIVAAWAILVASLDAEKFGQPQADKASQSAAQAVYSDWVAK